LLAKRERIDRLLAEEQTPPELKKRLQRVVDLCAFADSELGLATKGRYTSYVALDREYVVWNVFAAPKDSLDAVAWWYPFVGTLDYQGYFRRNLALSYANRLQDQGLDVYVGGVQAYSTVGWFRDPVLSTFVQLPETELAELLFHELTHLQVFVPGDTDFNEALATTVAREGVRRWLRRNASPEELEAFNQVCVRDDRVVELIQQGREELELLYETAAHLERAELLDHREDIFQNIRSDYRELTLAWPDYQGYKAWMRQPLNNAKLNAVNTYHRWVPALEILMRSEEHGLPTFLEKMHQLGKLKPETREWTLEQVAHYGAREQAP